MGDAIVALIRKAGNTLGVSMCELMRDTLNLYRANDAKGMRELFEAYRDWELRVAGSVKEATIRRVERNLDYIAQAADAFLTLGNEDLAFVKAASIFSEADDPGPIRRFYRASVGVNPPYSGSN